MGDMRPIRPEDDPPQGLTGIHRRIHCAATPGAVEECRELDAIAIDNLIDELASITISIARRSARPAEDID